MRVPLGALAAPRVPLGGGVLDFLTGHSNACGNPYQGTYSDVNCPTRCWVLGNGLDTAILGVTCWPCHNVCPTGTIWDTKNQKCATTPEEVNQEQAFACDYKATTTTTPTGDTQTVYTHQPGSGAGAVAPTPDTPDQNPEGCPGFCAWTPFAGTLFGECQVPACADITGSSSKVITYVLIGGGVLLAAVLLMGGRR